VGQALSTIPVVAQRLAKKLGAFLRKKRGDLTYAQFSRKTGISDSTLHRLELGEQNITLKTIEQLTQRLKCTVADLFED
jgi:transcriptional regulator with XRE-family HTH domain